MNKPSNQYMNKSKNQNQNPINKWMAKLINGLYE